MTTLADVRRLGLATADRKQSPLDARLAWAKALGEAWIRFMRRMK